MKYLLMLLLLSTTVSAEWKEADYVNDNCKGEIEVVLPDRTRVDCLTDTHAIEYDYGYKLYDAVGQSLHYSLMTGKKAGIVLIVKPESRGRHFLRLQSIINTIPCLPKQCPAIDVWLLPAKL